MGVAEHDGDLTVGHFQPGFWKRAAALTTLTFIDSAIANVSTITIPATAAGGDVAILFDNVADTGTPTDVVPTGWTGIVTATLGAIRLRVSYKILVSGDGGDSIAAMDGDLANDKVMFVFRGNVAITGVTPSIWLSEVTGGNPSLQTVSASGHAVPLLVLAMAAVTTGTGAFSTASPAFNATVLDLGSNIIAGYKIYNSSPANHSIDMNDIGSNSLASGYLICA